MILSSAWFLVLGAWFLTAKRWHVLAWDANPREREKIDSKSREATAGVATGHRAAHLPSLQDFRCWAFYFTVTSLLLHLRSGIPG